MKAVKPRVRWRSERRRVGVGDAPLTVQEYLQLCHEDDDYELLDGVLVKRMAAQLPHEWLFQWMLRLVGDYVEARGLGIALGSRTPVQITEHRSRLPDLLFVSVERAHILKPDILTEPPDWIMEIRSQGERDADWIRLESDYRTIRVPEIWMANPQNRTVRVLRLRDNEYIRTEQTEGVLRSETIEGFAVRIDDLFAEVRPKVSEVLEELLRGAL